MADPVDFTARLQQTCGDRSSYCEAFCSEATVGEAAQELRYRLGLHRVCRVVYRCGAETTQSFEAARNETISLNCRPQR